MYNFAFGPSLGEDGTRFRLWAPNERKVDLILDGSAPIAMRAADDGWHDVSVKGAKAGSRYRFRLGSGLDVPDPASRYQPEDVHGASEVVDPASYRWQQEGWKGNAWAELVIYELHVGSFTAEGTFSAAVDKLDHLVELGVNALQIMPVSDFPGRFGWGYDGAYPYAVEARYGRPDDLKRLIDECHARNICVFLDVVYNHFGPEGNYFPGYAPLFTHKHVTPWGDAINYDDAGSQEVRKFIIENAIYWITEFRFDGLRFDAVHAIIDDGETHLLDEISSRIRSLTAERHVHLILENEENDATLLSRQPNGAPERYTAQWNDDFHHALHVAITGETTGYYADYNHVPVSLGKAMTEGFVYQGQHMPYRGRARGSSSDHLPPTAFVSFLQNHDQVGNRAYGDRLSHFADERALRMGVCILLLSPQIPMLFMGEEWGTERPFPYFSDVGDDLKTLVREGRLEEMKHLPGFSSQHQDEAPDPTEMSTFLSSKLDWETGNDKAGDWFALYRQLIAVRRQYIVPLIAAPGIPASNYTATEERLECRWHFGATRLSMQANFSDRPIAAQNLNGKTLWPTEGRSRTGRLAPWETIWTLE